VGIDESVRDHVVVNMDPERLAEEHGVVRDPEGPDQTTFEAHR
jgi:hypothetical protein